MQILLRNLVLNRLRLSRSMIEFGGGKEAVDRVTCLNKTSGTGSHLEVGKSDMRLLSIMY